MFGLSRFSGAWAPEFYGVGEWFWVVPPDMVLYITLLGAGGSAVSCRTALPPGT